MGATSPLGVAQGQWFGMPNGLPNAPATRSEVGQLAGRTDGFADRNEFVMKGQQAMHAAVLTRIPSRTPEVGCMRDKSGTESRE